MGLCCVIWGIYSNLQAHFSLLLFITATSEKIHPVIERLSSLPILTLKQSLTSLRCF